MTDPFFQTGPKKSENTQTITTNQGKVVRKVKK